METSLSEDIIARLDTETELEIFSRENIFEADSDDIIILHMDIQEPLSSLRPIIEEKMGYNLRKFSFWLQNAQLLAPHKNLVDQCVKGEGLVQINVQVHFANQIINIVDVLKPTDEALEAEINKVPDEGDIKHNGNNIIKIEQIKEEYVEEVVTVNNKIFEKKVLTENFSKKNHSRNWIMDKRFKKKQLRLNIPDDPNDWSITHVKHWLIWAIKTFNLNNICLNDWNFDGTKLCSLTLQEFHQKIPNDPNNLFWTHIELLRKCKFAAVQQCSPPINEINKVIKLENSLIKTNNTITMPYSEPYASRSGNNGQIQLWQFLLDILTDPEHLEIIGWIGNEGEFKFIEPESVAQLWGERKNKPAMNYEKLSRALRYYYDGDMISKVTGKRYVYKFVCDLKQLIGYDARELSALVRSCKMNK